MGLVVHDVVGVAGFVGGFVEVLEGVHCPYFYDLCLTVKRLIIYIC